MSFFLLVAALLSAAPAPPALTLTPHEATLRIAVVGDVGDGSDAVAEGIRRVHQQKALDAIVLTGDNFYPCGVTSEHDERWKIVAPLTAIGVPIFPVLGNHDFCGKANVDAQIRASGVIANWRFPARQYALHATVADFAFIDSTSFIHHKSEPHLDELFRSSTAPWRIVVAHHPVISSGYHGYFPRAQVTRMREMIPALRQTHADLYIAGHDHHLELLRGRMLHLISGAGSDPIPPVKLRISTIYPSEVRRERIGFAVVEITASAIRVRFYDAQARPLSDWIDARVKSRILRR